MTMTHTYAEKEPTREQVEAMPGAVVLEFGAPWCVICQTAQSRIETALAERPEITHIKIEDAPRRRLGRSFRIKLWPTLVFLENGEEIDRRVRPASSQTISEALAKLS
ncbi:thioredoxin family protein [Halomonas sp. Bachu 37]|uniref:thioredoxin family protein n=1 Tax=Halomonas kashgarensis TaxID=3084920 RepID=UPI00321688FC